MAEPKFANTVPDTASSDDEKPSTTPLELESNNVPVVDAETEKKLLRKLDIRIIPFIMWMYLMNFMDRGKHTNVSVLR